MSEFTEKENERSCQKKLAPPRSIRDAGGKTQIVWDMIAKRYPKAAPLLSEMETAIDRAETLLHQLRRVPYDNDIVTKIRVSPTPSSTNQASYSDESEKQYSEASTRELSSTCEETSKEVEEVGTRTSYNEIPKIEDPSSTSSSASIEQVNEKETIGLKPHVPANDELTNSESPRTENQPQKLELHNQSNSSNYDEKRNLTTTKEFESLQGWNRVVGDEMPIPKKAHTKREVSIGRYENSTNRRNTKSEVMSMEGQSKTREKRGTVSVINNETSEPESVKVKKNRNIETVDQLERRAKRMSDSSPNQNPTTNPGSSSILMGTEKIEINDKHDEKNGDEKHSQEHFNKRKTPEEILKDYAVQNSTKLSFKIVEEKSKSFIMECCFAGCKAQHFGTSESVVRNELAMKILRIVAGKQMEDEDMKNLASFSDEQMRDIIAFGTDGEPENAMRKLYKFCLEENAPKPIYTVKQRDTAGNEKRFAECRAMRNVGHGSAIRDKVAKVLAAEDLYKKLYLQQTS